MLGCMMHCKDNVRVFDSKSNFLRSYSAVATLVILSLSKNHFLILESLPVKLEMGICVVPPACLTFSTTPETEYPKTWTYLQNLQMQSLLLV